MKPCWEHRGLTKRGAELADASLESMMRAIALASTKDGGTVADAVFSEAMFRLFDLKKRTLKFQRKYLRENAGRSALKASAGKGGE
jgi:hypothetical protein